jgi:hypothetical protein
LQPLGILVDWTFGPLTALETCRPFF